jgi:septum formation protein
MQINPKLSLILASKSPRRSYLLEQAGIPFTIRTADVEEVWPDDLDVLTVAPYLAELKAEGAAHLLAADNEVLLTADSVVIIDGIIYGKPTDRDDAAATLRKLAGSKHTVVTGCCLKSWTKKEVFAGVTEVYLDPLTEAEIDWYLDNCEPYDKAGSYGIQEWVGLARINRIEGTYPNVMGLPVNLVYERLVNWTKD